jgi:hypothetical protein
MYLELTDSLALKRLSEAQTDLRIGEQSKSDLENIPVYNSSLSFLPYSSLRKLLVKYSA